MEKPLKISRFAHTIFCEDLRTENSGKLLLIGVYGPVLLVERFPVVLPTFHVLVTISTPSGTPLKECRIVILRDDEIVNDTKIDTPEIVTSLSAEEQVAMATVQRFQMAFRHSPFLLEKPSVIRVRVETESETLAGGALEIQLAKQGEPQDDSD